MAERAALETRLDRGLVVVRADGCDVEILRDCHIQARYNYVATTRKRESVAINSTDELYANLPMGAAKLEGKLARGGRLEVNTVLVGMLEAPANVRTMTPEGYCEGATHYIAAAQLGAFEFLAAASSDVAAGVQVANAGAGFDRNRTRELLSTDGDPSICTDVGGGVPEPQSGCRAVIRIELTALTGSTHNLPRLTAGAANPGNSHKPPSWAHGELVEVWHPSLRITRLDGTTADLGETGRHRLLLFWDDSTREEMAAATNMMNVLQLAREELAEIGIDVVAVNMPFPERRSGAGVSSIASVAAFREKYRVADKPEIDVGLIEKSDGYRDLRVSPVIVIVDAAGIVRWHSDGVHEFSRAEKRRIEQVWRERADQWTINQAITFAKTLSAK